MSQQEETLPTPDAVGVYNREMMVPALTVLKRGQVAMLMDGKDAEMTPALILTLEPAFPGLYDEVVATVMLNSSNSLSGLLTGILSAALDTDGVNRIVEAVSKESDRMRRDRCIPSILERFDRKLIEENFDFPEATDE